jgi:Protein of unknown function (DUF4446)
MLFRDRSSLLRTPVLREEREPPSSGKHGEPPGPSHPSHHEPTGWLVSLELGVAVAAVALSALAVLSTLTAWSRLRALRRGQQAILGGSTTDVVDFAVSLQGRIDDLHRAVDEVAAGLTRVDRRLDGAVTNTSVVRYDAYQDAGGQQSASFVFLDSSRTGTVVTAIQGRDYARVYVKELERGKPSLALSPEEAEAVERAMAR